MSEGTVHRTAEAAKKASRVLARLSGERRNAALEAMAVALEKAEKELLAANVEDQVFAARLAKDGDLSQAAVERLKMGPAELAEMIRQIRAVGALPDPLGRKLDSIELDDEDPLASFGPEGAAIGLRMQKISVPLGVLAVIFEARPDAVTQIASLALKSGNAVILKPGREVERTAEVLVGVLREALAAQDFPKDAVSLVMGRARVLELLGESELVSLVIPRGSRALVEYVQANTRIPVLGHAEGINHIYVDRVCDQEMAVRVIEDAKCDYPSACNAVETVLIHRDIAEELLFKLLTRLLEVGVKVYCDDAVFAIASGGASPKDDWTGAPQARVASEDVECDDSSTELPTATSPSGGIGSTDDWTGAPQAVRSGVVSPMDTSDGSDSSGSASATGTSGGIGSTDDWTGQPKAMSSGAMQPLAAESGGDSSQAASGGGTTSTTTDGGANPIDDWGGPPRRVVIHLGDGVCRTDNWDREFCGLEIAIAIVDSLDAAIAHIHKHGSSHTESIITDNLEAAERFLLEVDAASVMHNASTRFADGFRYGFGAEVGISTSKFHARGPVGLEGLTTYKYVLRGNGHAAGDYRGENARAFTHRRADEASA